MSKAEDTEIEAHQTQNLNEASYLLAKGFKFTGKFREGAKTTLLFEGEGIKQASNNFYNGAKIEAKKYADAYRSLQMLRSCAAKK